MNRKNVIFICGQEEQNSFITKILNKIDGIRIINLGNQSNIDYENFREELDSKDVKLIIWHLDNKAVYLNIKEIVIRLSDSQLTGFYEWVLISADISKLDEISEYLKPRIINLWGITDSVSKDDDDKVIKKHFKERITALLNQINEDFVQVSKSQSNVSVEDNYIYIKTSDFGTGRFKPNDIVYFETSKEHSGHINIYERFLNFDKHLDPRKNYTYKASDLLSLKTTTDATLDRIEKELKVYKFARISKSCVVNLNYVFCWKSKEGEYFVVLRVPVNDSIIPIELNANRKLIEYNILPLYDIPRH